jgi:hypothetical protein
MPRFNYETAYSDSWRWFPNVKDAQLEYRSAAGVADPPTMTVHAVQEDVQGNDWASSGNDALMTDADLYFWYVWPEVGDGTDEVPQLDDVLIVDEVRYTIRSIGKGQHGARWRISTVEVVSHE